MKKMLMLASVASMIDQFNMSNIELLQKMGYEVHVACNFAKGSTCTVEKIQELKKNLEEKKVEYFQIDFERNVMKIHKDVKAYKQVLQLCRKNRYDFIHCHSPIGGVIGRLVAHKTNTKVIYTAHGFHFYKGAPIQNWLIYYPIEKFLSRFTDVLITINQEDYSRAKKKFYAKRVEYIPGIGIDVKKFQNLEVNKNEKRKKLGIGEEKIVLLSIGELSKRKNHEIVIKALAKLNSTKVVYLICGKGDLKKDLEKLSIELEIEKQIKFLGFRTDIAEICKCADIFVFPSLQEGLPVALMESMASGLPVACSKIRGNTDLINEEEVVFNPKSVEDIKEVIGKMIDLSKNSLERMGERNQRISKKFDKSIVEKMIGNIYRRIEQL